MKHKISLTVGAVLFGVLIYYGEPWIALVAIAGPIMALVLMVTGVSGAVIFTWLSAGKQLPILTVVGFLITAALAAYSFLIK